MKTIQEMALMLARNERGNLIKLLKKRTFTEKEIDEVATYKGLDFLNLVCCTSKFTYVLAEYVSQNYYVDIPFNNIENFKLEDCIKEILRIEKTIDYWDETYDILKEHVEAVYREGKLYDLLRVCSNDTFLSVLCQFDFKIAKNLSNEQKLFLAKRASKITSDENISAIEELKINFLSSTKKIRNEFIEYLKSEDERDILLVFFEALDDSCVDYIDPDKASFLMERLDLYYTKNAYWEKNPKLRKFFLDNSKNSQEAFSFLGKNPTTEDLKKVIEKLDDDFEEMGSLFKLTEKIGEEKILFELFDKVYKLDQYSYSGEELIHELNNYYLRSNKEIKSKLLLKFPDFIEAHWFV